MNTKENTLAGIGKYVIPPHAGETGDPAGCPGSGQSFARSGGGEEHCACCPPVPARYRVCPACGATYLDLCHITEGNDARRECPRHPGKTLTHQGHGADWDHNWLCPDGDWWGSRALDGNLVRSDY